MNRTKKKNGFGNKRLWGVAFAMSLLLAMGGCGAKGAAEAKEDGKQSEEKAELTILAAASLTDVCNELKTMYEREHSNVTLTFSYAGSGALQTQIEEGAPADLFISAAKKQMNALKEKNLMKEDTICNLLENKVVLIVPKDGKLELTSFEDVKKDTVTMIGIGEVESVPAGQYAKKIFTNLGLWETVEAKANFGTDVRTVLGWVETSAVSCGVVYATDAYSTDLVKIVAEAPEGSCDPVIYPAGVVASSKNITTAEAFLAFLKSDEAMKVFKDYGFVKAAE
ncbi:MAG: molybdate ABC transporter substrate-binding protein [Lachnospiraceae bacterium]|jgi:molybdate transport system substrate-binding protein|nr:molybdate ABC transporter substrate-binding protein [Lachnospiraceae bacterium]